MNSDTLWDAFQEGFAMPREALRALTIDLIDVLARKAGVTQDETTLRERIGLIVAKLDEPEPIQIEGFNLEVRDASTRQSYNSRALNELARQLTETGLKEIADQILACRTTQAIAGGLVITPTKAAKERIATASSTTRATVLPDLSVERSERWIEFNAGTLDISDTGPREERAV